MACGLPYGELLLLCTLISFDLVVHGARTEPRTLGTELQVVDQEEKKAVNAGEVSGTEDFEGPFENEAISGQNMQFGVFPNEYNTASKCAEKCRRTNECISFEFWTGGELSGRCQLSSASTDTEHLVYSANISYYQLRDKLSVGILGPFVGMAIAGQDGVSTGTTYAYVENASACAEKCSQAADCMSFGFKARLINAAGTAACYWHSGTRCSVGSAYKKKNEWDYYEVKESNFDVDVHGFDRASGQHEGVDIIDESEECTLSACADRCTDNNNCKSFNFEKGYSHRRCQLSSGVLESPFYRDAWVYYERKYGRGGW